MNQYFPGPIDLKENLKYGDYVKKKMKLLYDND